MRRGRGRRATGHRLATVAVAVLAAGTGCRAAGEPATLDAAPATLTPTAVATVTPTGSPTPTPTPSPHRPTLPDGTRTLIPGHRLVAFYGAAGAPSLGVLGTGSPEQVWPRLRRQARPYRAAPARVLPTYELIAYLATSGPGDHGTYSSRVKDRTIRRYARAAKRHHAMLILDIQPGRGRFIDDAKSLRRWLRKPYVGLALDPEWKLYGRQRPLQQIGHTTARQVNHVSRWLAALTRATDLPQKPLLVHQFTAQMVRHKADVRTHRRLAMVFNVDGFGSKRAKVSKYEEFAADRRFPLGFKVFYDYDHPVMSPREVLRLRPRPVVVEYQ